MALATSALLRCWAPSTSDPGFEHSTYTWSCQLSALGPRPCLGLVLGLPSPSVRGLARAGAGEGCCCIQEPAPRGILQLVLPGLGVRAASLCCSVQGWQWEEVLPLPGGSALTGVLSCLRGKAWDQQFQECRK